MHFHAAQMVRQLLSLAERICQQHSRFGDVATNLAAMVLLLIAEGH